MPFDLSTYGFKQTNHCTEEHKFTSVNYMELPLVFWGGSVTILNFEHILVRIIIYKLLNNGLIEGVIL